MTFYRNALLGGTDEKIVNYISSMDEDKLIVDEVIEVLIAHVTHLTDKGLIPCEVGSKALKALHELLKEKDRDLLFKLRAEDIHEALEAYLTDVLGVDAGWVSLGRSRNDHVATALRLKMKKLVIKLIGELLAFREVLLKKARKNLDILLPLSTHLQPAQVSTAAHYLMYVEEMLASYTNIIRHVLNEFIDKSPLGSGAVAGTTVPLDRFELARLLRFNGLVKNTLLATGSRDFIYVTASVITSLAVSMSRIAEDFIVWATPQFNYIEPPTSHLATSSMMPHKKNLVTMEVLRAWGGEAVGHLTAILTVMKATPSGYNLDLQEVTKHLLRLILNTIEAVTILKDFIENMEFKKEVLHSDACKYPLTVTDIAELLSIRYNKPYREVHKELASLMKEFRASDISKIYKEISSRLGISLEELINAATPENALGARKVVGSPNPELVLKSIEECEEVLNTDLSWYAVFTAGFGGRQ